MQLDRDQLAALSAVLRVGSFEGAAAELGLTQPAVSLRIRALEEHIGMPLVRRASPCTPTRAGQRLARHAEDVALLERGALADLDLAEEGGHTRAALAVNADSLATWFAPVLGAVPGLLLDVQIDDQDHSAAWLMRGEVNAAVTGTPKAAAGCDVTALGAMRYVATAAPAFMDRWFPDGVTAEALSRAPAFAFNVKDQLQARWMQMKVGRKLFPPCHMIPSTHGFIDAATAGAGWGMNPLALVAEELARGQLVALDDSLFLDVPLYWQISRRMKRALGDLDQAVRRTAKSALIEPS